MSSEQALGGEGGEERAGEGVRGRGGGCKKFAKPGLQICWMSAGNLKNRATSIPQLFEKFWRILLYVTDDAIAKLNVQ